MTATISSGNGSGRLLYRTCPLCEAMCGLELEVEGDRLLRVRGDAEDPLSRGFICAKARALKEVHEDPERLRRPLRRTAAGWAEVGWEEALEETAERLAEVRRRYGPDSVAFYTGNPNLHSYTASLLELELARSLGTRARFSTASMDHLPHLLASYLLYGHQFLIPVPDLDRTELFLVVGANPVVSNGSLMGAPGMPVRLKRLRRRGGRLVVVDPRRTPTAEMADVHHAIRPGTDALLLLAMVHVLFDEQLEAPGRLAAFTRGIEAVRRAAEPFAPEEVATRTGIAAREIRTLAREFAAAPAAVAYCRVGGCTQQFGALTAWLVQVLNLLTGNLDREGGSMFPRPAVDVVKVASLLGRRGSFATYRSRVRGLPEFGGELPVAVLAEEIDTPGPGQIRALLTSAGNPVLSTPNGGRLDRALPGLEFMAAIDLYLNETTRHAHLILPPVFALERDHYDLGFRLFGVRNTTRYTPPVFDPPPGSRQDWQVYAELAIRLDRRRGGVGGRLGALRGRLVRWLTPQGMLDLFLRTGPWGPALGLFGEGLSKRRLLADLHTRDLGPLEPCLPGRLYTRGHRIELAPAVYLRDLERLAGTREAAPTSAADGLVLIGRRQPRTNNSWMHNAPELARRGDRCTLLMHPDDARQRRLAADQPVEVRSRVGAVVVPLELTDKIRPGVVSLPHGFGHGRRGTRLSTAARQPGASLNDLTDERRLDELSGTVSYSGVPVEVTAAG